jgi:hypothetical protein
MSIPIATASPWPARAAYFSAAIFSGASGITNLNYGWSKGSDPASSLVWAGVAGAVAVVFALSCSCRQPSMMICACRSPC